MTSKIIDKELQPLLTYLATFAIAILAVSMCIHYDYSILKTILVSLFVAAVSFVWLRGHPVSNNPIGNEANGE